MNLLENDITAHKNYVGSGVVSIPAGKSFKIETTPEGEEVLDMEVPVGKVWQVTIHVAIDETDAA